MMKHLAWLLCLFLVINCSSEEDISNNSDASFIKNSLTLEISFGDDIRNGEYLLAGPSGIMVDKDGNIYVTDETSVKVFSPDGEPKTIFGGKGQGPGEFNVPQNPGLSPTGYITVMNVLWEYNVYRPDHKFVKLERITQDLQLNALNRRDGLSLTMMEQVYALDSERHVIELTGLNMDVEGIFPVYQYLLYQQPDTLIEVARYNIKGTVR
ncbi:hypothetical protein ACFL7D_07590 [candidate division KSB1 bacterium]